MHGDGDARNGHFTYIMQVDEARLLSCVLQLALIQRLQFRMKSVFFRLPFEA